MGKKNNSSTAAAAAISSQPHLQQAPSGTMREESSGKKQSSVNPKSMLKLDHLKNLAIWATAEASVSSLGAFFGYRLAATAEALGVPPDPSLFSCQRWLMQRCSPIFLDVFTAWMVPSGSLLLKIDSCNTIFLDCIEAKEILQYKLNVVTTMVVDYNTNIHLRV
ncbi:uncharacterized protein [Coffea arabica]|uniref:Uncharacterized protein isoform X2 n=1 Tax=Coffea arabica TaxID=13443 RepID=A0ABM4VDJ4_COFAR|nr:uncharacterized protein LOC113704229 isoform X2 [Coffea arabica]